jgi:tyrosine-protein kinase Etk/Wzc
VISRGKIPPNPSELLMHKNFTELVNAMKATYDIVIIDTPPILAVTDAAIIAGSKGTISLVARYAQNTVREIAYASQRFEQTGIDVKGVVKNAHNAYGYYSYAYKSDKE